MPIYRLRYDPAAEAVHEAMPPAASEALTLALADACHNPLDATQPYGDIEDEVMRMIVTEQAFAVLLIGQTLKTITVLQVTYLG